MIDEAPILLSMKRRHLLAALATFPFAHGPAFAAEPWQAKLLRGRFDGKAWRGGLMLALAENWKTYWRMPGAGGIAPEVQASGENLQAFSIQLPLPQRFSGEGGDIIGYKNEVVFPFRAEAREPLSPVTLTIQAFLGVCDMVCIPVRFTDRLTFDPANIDLADEAMIERWLAQVPKLVQETGPVRTAELSMQGSKMILSLDLSEQPTDIFVEGQPLHYFHAPVLTHGRATLEVTGAKQLADLRKSPLRITLSMGGQGIEQVIMPS